MHKILYLVLITFLLVGCGGDSSDSTSEVVSLRSLQMTPFVNEIPVGASYEFKVRGYYTNQEQVAIPGNKTAIEYDPDLVSIEVGETIKITGLKEGSFRLSVSYEDKTESRIVRVTPPYVESVTVVDEPISLTVGQTYRPEFLVHFSDGTVQKREPLSFMAFDTNIITITDGEIYAVAPGNSYVEASFLEDLWAAFDVEVTEYVKAIERVYLEVPRASLSLGQAIEIKAFIEYEDGSTLDVTDYANFNSSDVAVLSMLHNFVMPNSVGSATVTVYYGQHSASITISVSPYQVINFFAEPLELGLLENTRVVVPAWGLRSNGQWVEVTEYVNWYSHDESVVSIDGYHLIAESPGQTEVVAEYQGFTHGVEVSVYEMKVDNMRVYASSEEVQVHENLQLYAETDIDGEWFSISKKVFWESSDETIATVSNHSDTAGKVMTRAAGAVTFTASYGSISQTVTVNIVRHD